MTRRKRLGCILIAAGILLLALGSILLLHYGEQERAAGNNAEVLLQHLLQELDRQETAAAASGEEEILPPGEMPRTLWNGYGMIGVLSAQKIGLQLPILDDWSYERLALAPCRYAGTVGGGDLILLGHNYKTHFGPLRSLQIGDRLELRTVDGAVHRYRVTGSEVLQPTELDRLMGLEGDLTLFTCTPGGTARLAVCCVRED